MFAAESGLFTAKSDNVMLSLVPFLYQTGVLKIKGHVIYLFCHVIDIPNIVQFARLD
jgi:hypothetical protein